MVSQGCTVYQFPHTHFKFLVDNPLFFESFGDLCSQRLLELRELRSEESIRVRNLLTQFTVLARCSETRTLRNIFAELKNAQKLSPAVFQREKFSKGDQLIELGEYTDRIHFLVNGRVQIQGEGIGRKELVPGNIIGEISSLLQSEVTALATVIALSNVETFSLPRRQFQKLSDDNPSLKDCLKALAFDRLMENHASAA